MMILHHQDQGWEVRRSVFNVAAADSTGQKHWDAGPNVTPGCSWYDEYVTAGPRLEHGSDGP